MCKKIVSVAFLVICLGSLADCALRKSWKSRANFEADIPKFTPFEGEEISSGGGSSIKKTEVITEPTPSAETLTNSNNNNKISSRIKMPEKYVADIYSTLTKEATKKSQDFGRFAYQVPEIESSEEDENDNEIPSSKHLINHSGEEEIDDASEDDEEDEVEVYSTSETTHLKVGQLLNVTVDSEDNTVNVNLDQHTLKDIFSGRHALDVLMDEKSHFLFNLRQVVLATRKWGCWSASCPCSSFLSSFSRPSYPS
jgi:hypothetical protein